MLTKYWLLFCDFGGLKVVKESGLFRRRTLNEIRWRALHAKEF